jgi:hypothetical protein
MIQLNEPLLRRYMAGFFGYGHFDAPVWFIGAEEGGGADAEEIARRMQAWHDRGGHLLEDLQAFHEQAMIPFPRSLQPTWRPLMIAALIARNESVTDAVLQRFQNVELGSFGGQTCLLERLPLPKRSATQWPYNEWSTVAELKTRALYQRTTEPARVRRILGFVRDHRPSVVVFYGNRRDWRKRLPPPIEQQDAFDVGMLGITHWYTTAHPTAWTNDAISRFSRIGTHIKANGFIRSYQEGT